VIGPRGLTTRLVRQLFTLMDLLLRKENLDLKLSPYDVLASGPSQGMAQFIPSMAIASIITSGFRPFPLGPLNARTNNAPITCQGPRRTMFQIPALGSKSRIQRPCCAKLDKIFNFSIFLRDHASSTHDHAKPFFSLIFHLYLPARGRLSYGFSSWRKLVSNV
jgi:hypothetical protein